MKRRISIAVLTAVLGFQFLTAQTETQHNGSASGQGAQAAQQTKPKCTDNGSYVNAKGETVKRPENCSAAPEGAA